MGKCSKIRCIVRVRQMLRRWRMRAATSFSSRASAAPLPPDVPPGHVALCVGSSSRRFVVRAGHLNHPVFRQLLGQAEEEYGFSSHAGPISLPCDETLFESILRHLSSSASSTALRFANLEDFQKFSSSCGCCRVRRWPGGESFPLLHGLADEPVW